MDHIGPSRRAVLASLGGIGVAGAMSGAGTYAILSAEKSFGGSIQSGTVSIELDGRVHPASFSVDGIDRGESGVETLEVVVGTNPAWLWLDSDCPPSIDRLGDALLVTLRWDGSAVESGTLSAVRRSLRSGVLLGGSCTAPGEAVDLELVWELPEDTAGRVAGETTTVEFGVVAEQCRHNDAGAAANPFDPTPCAEPMTCVPCPRSDDERIAGARFEYDGPDAVPIELRQQQSGNSPQTDYAFGALDPGDTFSTDLPGAGKPDIDVLVDGEKIGDFHISCSQPFGPGLVIGDGTYGLTVLEATDKAGNDICEVEK